LSYRIHRQKIKGTGVRKAASPETEPYFYSMPFLPQNGAAESQQSPKPESLFLTPKTQPLVVTDPGPCLPAASSKSASTPPLERPCFTPPLVVTDSYTCLPADSSRSVSNSPLERPWFPVLPAAADLSRKRVQRTIILPRAGPAPRNYTNMSSDLEYSFSTTSTSNTISNSHQQLSSRNEDILHPAVVCARKERQTGSLDDDIISTGVDQNQHSRFAPHIIYYNSTTRSTQQEEPMPSDTEFEELVHSLMKIPTVSRGQSFSTAGEMG
jgi:hypothetical protein